MGTLEFLRRLIRLQTNNIDEVVENWYGAVAGNIGGLVAPRIASWAKASLPGSALISLDEFYTLFSSQEVQDYEQLRAVDGVVLGREDTPSVMLLRGLVNVPLKQTISLTVDVGSSAGEFAVYVDGKLTRRGSNSLTISLALDKGKHMIEVVAVASAVIVAVPPTLEVSATKDAPPVPVWVSVTPGYVDQTLGTPANELRWWSEPRAGGWRVLKREFEFLDQITAIGELDTNGRFSVTVAGDWTSTVQTGEQLHALQQTLGTVVSVRAESMQPLAPDDVETPASTETIITIALDRTLQGLDLAWVGAIAATGSFVEAASIKRVVTSGQVSWFDSAIVVGRAYEYALQAFGVFDRDSLSARSETRYLTAGDTEPPGPITFVPGYPKSVNARGIVRYRTPDADDYAGVNVYFREEIEAVIESISGSDIVLSTAALVGRTLADDNWFVVVLADSNKGEDDLGITDGAARPVVSNTANTVSVPGDQPWGGDNEPAPGVGSTIMLYKMHAVTTDRGRPRADDELSFDIQHYGAGRYIFRTFDLSNNEQLDEDAESWGYTGASSDQYVGGGATSGVLRAVVADDLADLYLTVNAPEYLFPITAEVYEDDPSNPAKLLVTHVFTADGQQIGPSDDPALSKRGLPLNEVRRWYARFFDTQGNVTWAFTAADRDALPTATVSLDDYSADGRPSLYIHFDDDTDEVRVQVPSGKFKTFTNPVDGFTNIFHYRVNETQLDDTTQEAALTVDQVTGLYRVEAVGGGVVVEVWRGFLHGRPAKAPITLARSVLNDTKDKSSLFVLVTSSVGEALRLHFKDSESDAAPIWSLVTGNGDSTPLFVASGTEIDPATAWFYNGISYGRVMLDINLVRDQVRRVFVQAEAEQSLVRSGWDTVGLSSVEKPWIESIDLVWDEANSVLVLRGVAGAFCRSAKFEVSQDENFGSSQSVQVAFADGTTYAQPFALAGDYRDRTWHGRITPFNGVLVGGNVAGLAGQAQRDSTYIATSPSVVNQPPIINIRQLTSVEQALFPDLSEELGPDYTDLSRWVIVLLDGADPITGSGGVVIHYQKKGEVECVLDALTSPLTAGLPNNIYPVNNPLGPATPYVVDDPAGTRSRYIAIERGSGMNWIRAWAVDENGAGLTSQQAVYRVDFNTIPEIVAVEPIIDGNATNRMGTDGTVQFQIAVDDDTRSYKWWFEPAESNAETDYVEPSADIEGMPPTTARIDDTAVMGSVRTTITYALGDGKKKLFRVQPFSEPNCAGTPGEIITKDISRPPRSEATFENKDQNGRTSASTVKMTMMTSPAIPQVYPADRNEAAGVLSSTATDVTLDGNPGFSENLFQTLGTRYAFVEVVMVRSINGVSQTMRVCREIASNTEDSLHIDGSWPSSTDLADPTRFYPKPGDQIRVFTGAVYYRIGEADPNRSGEYSWAPNWTPMIAPTSVFFERATGKLVEYHGVADGCPAEAVNRVFSDEDNVPSIDSVSAIKTNEQELLVTISGLDDDVKYWRSYERKGPLWNEGDPELWPTDDGKVTGVPLDKYLRNELDAKDRSYKHAAGTGCWYVIAVPYNSYNDPGDRKATKANVDPAQAPKARFTAYGTYANDDPANNQYRTMVYWNHENVTEDQTNVTVNLYIRSPSQGWGSATVYGLAQPNWNVLMEQAPGVASQNIKPGVGEIMMVHGQARGNSANGDPASTWDFQLDLYEDGVLLTTYKWTEVMYFVPPEPRFTSIEFHHTNGYASYV